MLYASYVVAATRVGNKHTVEATRADKIRQQKKAQKGARALLESARETVARLAACRAGTIECGLQGRWYKERWTMDVDSNQVKWRGGDVSCRSPIWVSRKGAATSDDESDDLVDGQDDVVGVVSGSECASSCDGTEQQCAASDEPEDNTPETEEETGLHLEAGIEVGDVNDAAANAAEELENEAASERGQIDEDAAEADATTACEVYEDEQTGRRDAQCGGRSSRARHAQKPERYRGQ